MIIGAGTLVNKDLEGGYVYAGVPAKKICTFDEFVERRKRQVNYPQDLVRNGDSIDKESAQILWSDFYKKKGSIDPN